MSGGKGGGKADTLVKVVLFFFISLLSFSVGTFVGKQVSDSDHRRMALEGEYSGRQIASVNEQEEPAAAEGESKISEKEVEALTEEFVNREKAREPSATGSATVVEAEPVAEEPAKEVEGYKSVKRGKTETAAAHGDAHAATVKATEGVKAVAEKVATGQAPTDGEKAAKPTAPTLPSVASSAVGKYTVQVGSYVDEKEAKEHAASLKGKGWNAFYLPATVKGKTWYRVLVGLFNNQNAAKQFRAQFMKESNTQAAIVQKIVQ